MKNYSDIGRRWVVHPFTKYKSSQETTVTTLPAPINAGVKFTLEWMQQIHTGVSKTNYAIIIPTRKLVWLRLSIILAYLTSACVLILDLLWENDELVCDEHCTTNDLVWKLVSQEECRLGTGGCRPINMHKPKILSSNEYA